MNNTLTKSRTPYVDIAKGLAILSVVLLHVDYVYPKLSFVNINGMLGWFWHVPVFFLIGGFFLKDERLANPVLFIKGKMKSLYLLALSGRRIIGFDLCEVAPGENGEWDANAGVRMLFKLLVYSAFSIREK